LKEETIRISGCHSCSSNFAQGLLCDRNHDEKAYSQTVMVTEYIIVSVYPVRRERLERKR